MIAAVDSKRSADVRAAMIDILGAFGDGGTPNVLTNILRKSGEPEAVQLAALSALAHYDDETVLHALLDSYRALPVAARARAMDLMLARPKWAAKTLDAIDAGAIAPADVSVEQLRRVSEFGDKTLDARMAKRWGKIAGGGTPEEKLAEVRRLNNDLRAAPGDEAAGKAIFMNTCGTCHALFGEGKTVGPDLTHANRADRNYMLVSIVDPSSVIRAEHLAYAVRTTDGRILSGLLVDQGQAGVTLLDAKGERVSVARDKVQAMKESPVSLMPEGLLTPLKPQELRDLFAYLQSNP
jgi:putative heme-binding domain-containing protein